MSSNSWLLWSVDNQLSKPLFSTKDTPNTEPPNARMLYGSNYVSTSGNRTSCWVPVRLRRAMHARVGGRRNECANHLNPQK